MRFFFVVSMDAGVSVVPVLCDQFGRVVPAHLVDDADEAYRMDPLHQVDHKDEFTGRFCIVFASFWAVFASFWVVLYCSDISLGNGPVGPKALGPRP